ncbi:hypothetical protein AAE02nite_16610 [Adhaeribacter aerolatus]|uniref:Uncharacterized protein n=1 Tax=Adhaeribacter aerolatus TaxID=670289 RepID=A0A512AWW1_9BACT|nr:hypothetical protein [Adhaeribacter aerolatus]GEO03997.1 hypothetical protein AAE02nite_16610 [Adhaeribacter aerolatus]
MQNQYTLKNSLKSFPIRAAALLFLTLCLLISCPLKRELKTAFLGHAPTGNQSAAAQFPKQITNNVSAYDFELTCTKVVHSFLDEVETNSFFQKFDFKNPAVFLVISLAGLYLLLLAARGNKNIPHTFPVGFLAAKIPLFLRYRQLVI